MMTLTPDLEHFDDVNETSTLLINYGSVDPAIQVSVVDKLLVKNVAFVLFNYHPMSKIEHTARASLINFELLLLRNL
jgi:hypothetical protein